MAYETILDALGPTNAAKRKSDETQESDPRFVPVVDAFARERSVSRGGGKGFGSRALKVKGKIFAMSSKGQFVVKLPKERVGALAAAGKGEYFDPGHGRLMKEWLAVEAGRMSWLELAREAYDFVKRR
jgi:hypothetical protein